MMGYQQGDILKIEKIKYPVLVVSKNFFNASGEIIGCPIYSVSSKSPLHIPVFAKEMIGEVQCEKMALLDLTVRGHKKIDHIELSDIINITDAIQSIFDYI
jgi:mRNA-degrading endonuclease toxin of MazEF toxin-antitoxin module